ncbi:MAG: 4Fe-4S dicluster domain-containing protein [Desulfobacterota bacterium]|nr:4Fe-4S dicluster domain-containing protein [Thermodesulfobacteriota bacterium]
MKQLLLDHERCTGCSLCELICGLAHFRENNPKKSAVHIKRKFPAPGSFEIQVCNQCGRCKEVCPVEAISEREGALVIDPEKCTFCQVCIEECPYGVLYTHRDIPIPIKCDLCGECVTVCAPEAIRWRES